MFRATFIDSYQGRAMADYAFGQLKARTAAVVYDERQAYSKGLAAFFKQSFLADGGQVPVYVDVSSDDSFAAAVAALKLRHARSYMRPFTMKRLWNLS